MWYSPGAGGDPVSYKEGQKGYGNTFAVYYWFPLYHQ